MIRLLISTFSILLSGILACVPTAPEDGELTILPSENTGGDSNTLSFGIVPQQSPADIERNWGPLARFLEETTGLKVHIKTASSIPIFEERCAAGAYDLSYMNPYHYVVYAEAPGYRAVARQKDKRIQGIIVVPKDSPENPLSHFEGAELAFPSPAAFAASLLTRAYFTRSDIPITPVYVRTHDSVYKAVADGLYPAGGGVKRTFKATDPAIREKLRIAWTTDLFTPHAFAAHPRVPEENVKKIRDALLTLTSPEARPDLLDPIKFKGWAAAEDSDWDEVRALGLTALSPGNSP
jgi:phosphonate transport system substrate-binding protein